MKNLLIILISMVALAGCAQTNQWTKEASKQNLVNAEVTRQAVHDFMTTWSLNSGFIQCGAEEIIPVSTLKDIQKMDAIVIEANLWSTEDYQAGCFMGIGTKLTSKQIHALIEWAIGMIAKAR